MEPRTFTILGTPVPLMRPRFSKGKVFDPQSKEKLYYGAQLRQQYVGEFYEGPLGLVIDFFFPIPKSKQKHHDTILGSSHIFKPDLDNCIKWVCDICTNILFENDNIICEIVSKKIYDDNPRTVFTIYDLNADCKVPEEIASRIRKQIGGRHNNGSYRRSGTNG